MKLTHNNHIIQEWTCVHPQTSSLYDAKGTHYIGNPRLLPDLKTPAGFSLEEWVGTLQIRVLNMKKMEDPFRDPYFVNEALVEWRHFVCSESGDAEQRVFYACDICGDSKIIIKSRGD